MYGPANDPFHFNEPVIVSHNGIAFSVIQYSRGNHYFRREINYTEQQARAMWKITCREFNSYHVDRLIR